jgi:hypothetical protein
MMIFGGNANTETGFPQLNDAWVLRNANGLAGTPRWSKLNPAGTKPGGRTSHVGGYDSANNRLIIYGGGSWGRGFLQHMGADRREWVALVGSPLGLRQQH